MSVHKYTAGARTRNVVNIADPGGTSAAYTLTDSLAAPTLATHGYKNFHSQKTLHALFVNTSDQTMTWKIWVYNSSLGGIWAPLNLFPERENNGDNLILPVVTEAQAAGNITTQYHRIIVPIEGIERIAVQVTKGGAVTTGNFRVWLGVNSI